MTPLFAHHPSERARVGYALGDADRRDRADVAAHLLRCAACRAEVQAIASLQQEAQSLASATSPSLAPTGVLDRVLAARAAGVRRIVPRTVPRPARRRVSWLLVPAGAAVLVIAFSMRQALNVSPPAIPEISTGLFGPTLAFAQEGIPVVPSPLDASRIAALRSATAEYRLQWFDATGDESASTRTTEQLVVPLNAGAPLVLVRTTPRPAGAQVDSLVLDRGSLTPILQVLRRSRFRIVDSIAGGVLARSFPARDRGGPIVTRTTSRAVPRAVAGRPFLLAPGVALPLYLRTAGIGPGSRIAVVEVAGRFDAESLAASTSTLVARVVGEDRVTTPAGTFDSWRLELEHTPRDVRQLLWLEKGSQVLVRARRLVRGARSMETVLTGLTR